MIDAPYMQLVNLAPQAFTNHMAKWLTPLICSAVRATLSTMAYEPLVQTRLAKMLTAAHNYRGKNIENFRTNLTD